MKKTIGILFIVSTILIGCGSVNPEADSKSQAENIYAENESQPEVTNPVEAVNSENMYVEDLALTLNFEFGEREGIYTGHLVNGLPDGIGKFTSASEDGTEWTHIGEWSEGHFNGLGTLFRADGLINATTYENDRENGYGVVILDDNSVYVGGMKDSKFSGNGLYLSLENRFIGEYEDGLLNGNATCYFSYETMIEGTYEQDRLNGDCTIVVDDTKIVGTFRDSGSGLNGTGEFYSDDGTILKCEFKDGELLFPEIAENQVGNHSIDNAIPDKEQTGQFSINANDEPKVTAQEPNSENVSQQDPSTAPEEVAAVETPQDLEPDTPTPVGGTVWLSATGEKYHRINNCGKMNPDKARQISLEEAQRMNYERCTKCW